MVTTSIMTSRRRQKRPLDGRRKRPQGSNGVLGYWQASGLQNIEDTAIHKTSWQTVSIHAYHGPIHSHLFIHFCCLFLLQYLLHHQAFSDHWDVTTSSVRMRKLWSVPIEKTKPASSWVTAWLVVRRIPVSVILSRGQPEVRTLALYEDIT